jgi:HEAT repeat protein
VIKNTRSSLFITSLVVLFTSLVLPVNGQVFWEKEHAERWQVEGIIAALQDPLPSVQLLALNYIGSFSGFQGISVSQVASLLKYPDSDVRRAAASALGAMQATDRAGELVKLLTDPVDQVRRAALSSLAHMHAKDQADEVAKLLKHVDPSVRSTAAYALSAMQARDHAGEVVKLLKDSNLEVRRAAASALGDMQARDQAGEVVKLLKDSNFDVRVAAVSALGAMQARDQAREVVKLLKDPSISVVASGALGAMKARDQAGEIVKLLKDTNSNIVRAAASALGAMQASEEVPELTKLLKNPTPPVRAAAAEVLGDMQAKDQAGEMLKLLADSDGDVRSAAVSALDKMRATDQVAAVKLLKDPAPHVRAAALRALGAMQAKDQAGEVSKLLTDSDGDVRTAAAWVLSQMLAKDLAAKMLVKLLKDPDASVRMFTVRQLGEMKAKDQAGEVTKLLDDPEYVVRVFAASTLEHMGPFPRTIIPILSQAYYFNQAQQVEVRFLCYYLTGGDPLVKLLLQRIMFEAGQKPGAILSVGQARATLLAFKELLPAKPTYSGLSVDAERQILQIAREWRTEWSPSDRKFFTSLGNQMSDESATALRGVVEVPWLKTALRWSWRIVLVQIAFWILLLCFYPTSTQVQAFFFWNRWARKFFGLGYVDMCLTLIPLLRNCLLSPFREELLADARVGDKDLEEYFEDVQVQEEEKKSRLSEAIPEVRGQIVLEGESGLGKSMFLRRLVKNTKQPTAYLPAEKCAQGVFELIQLRLKGKAGDESFLKSIIWSGGLRIVVDGLNEVTVETREKILRFLDDFPKAHILLSTQPMLWKRPPKARALKLLTFSDDRILSFLQSRYVVFGPAAAMSEDEYKQRCGAYIGDVLGPAQTEEDRSGARLVLSNPMDLTTSAQILVWGDLPTLSNLQEQQFRRMSREFLDARREEFPLKQFSESVYKRLLRDVMSLDSGRFFAEVQAMARHKMALGQHDTDADGKPRQKWVFRHDKIRDYFLVNAFRAQESKRILRYIDDPRFRGVYLMLASQLPLEQARDLKDALVDRAAETKEHNLSDAVVQLLKTRKLEASKSVGQEKTRAL